MPTQTKTTTQGGRARRAAPDDDPIARELVIDEPERDDDDGEIVPEDAAPRGAAGDGEGGAVRRVATGHVSVADGGATTNVVSLPGADRPLLEGDPELDDDDTADLGPIVVTRVRIQVKGRGRAAVSTRTVQLPHKRGCPADPGRVETHAAQRPNGTRVLITRCCDCAEQTRTRIT